MQKGRQIPVFKRFSFIRAGDKRLQQGNPYPLDEWHLGATSRGRQTVWGSGQHDFHVGLTPIIHKPS
jgi:hypothetical protein